MSCVLCNYNESIEIAKVGRHNLPVRNVICKRCGLVYVDPQPNKEELQEYYDNEFRKKHIRRDKEEKDIKKRRNMVLNFLSEFLFKDMNVLEIGCADGALLNAIDEFVGSKNLYGVEPTSELANKAADSFGINVYNGLFEDYSIENKFDLIIMQHVLEHCADPLETLKKLRTMLSDSGVVYIEVPNARKPYGDFIDYFLQVPHLYSFTSKTLKALFKLAGFKVKIEAVGALSFILDKSDEPQSVDFENIESYKELLHFFKVYTSWYRIINEKDPEKTLPNQYAILTDDNELAKEISKMHFQTIKNLLRGELKKGNDSKVKSLLSVIENDQPLTEPEAIEYLLLRRNMAKKRGDESAARRYDRRLKMIRKMIDDQIEG